jgi:hypothetical protein
MGVKILRGATAARSAGSTSQRNMLDPSFVERVRAKAAASSRTLTAKAQRIVEEHDRNLARITDPKLKASALKR